MPADLAVGRPSAAVIVVNYGSSDLLALNLPASTSSGDLVIVVDSATDQTEREKVRALCVDQGWLLETPDHNTGFGAGMNLGVARALAEGAGSLLLLNPDASIEPAAAKRLIAQVSADRNLLLAPRILKPDGSPWMGAIMDLNLSDGTVNTSRRRQPGAEVMEWVSGAVMALSAELWIRIGGFDEDYFLYWEDIDLCKRVHEAGGGVRVDEGIVAVHDEGGTHADGDDRAKSESYYYYNIRNRALYAAKWLSPADRKRWARLTPRTAWETILKGGRRQLVGSLRPWRAYLRGVAAASRKLASVSSTPLSGPPESVCVLESFPPPSHTTNPYITQLRDSIASTPGVELRCWTWRYALLGKYDVFHTHWTEAKLARHGAISTVARRVLFAVFLARLWITRTPIVRTLHNLDLPSGLSVDEIALLRMTERLTVARIVLNEFTPVPTGSLSAVIPHGHYRDWFSHYPEPQRVRGRIVFFGKVRRYKNVEGLARTFSELLDEGEQCYTLHVAGSPSTSVLRESLEELAAADPRISLKLGFVEDCDLVTEVGESELVVLPYHEMHNSGSVLAALSLNRPVLVPDNEFNRRLAAEVGRGWVLTYSDDLTVSDLLQALAESRKLDVDARPDLTSREWAQAGKQHLAAFRAALSGRPGRWEQLKSGDRGSMAG